MTLTANTNDVLFKFANSEDRKSLLAQLRRTIQVGATPVLLACSIGSLFSQPFGWNKYGWLHYALWSLTALAIPVSIAGLRPRHPEFFGTRELESARRSEPAR